MTECTGKLARWSLGFSELEFDIVHRAGIKHQTADALSRIKTNSEDKTVLDDEVQVFTKPQSLFPCASQKKTTDFEVIEERNGTIVPLIPEVCMIVGNTRDGKVEMLTLAEFITAQAIDTDCHAAFTPAGNPNASFNFDSDGVLVRVYPSDGASQRVVPACLHSDFFHACHYSLPADLSGKLRMYYSIKKDSYWTHTAIDV